jgi:hypothetical protein
VKPVLKAEILQRRRGQPGFRRTRWRGPGNYRQVTTGNSEFFRLLYSPRTAAPSQRAPEERCSGSGMLGTGAPFYLALL